MWLEQVADEIVLILKLLAAFIIVLIGSLVNYLRTLDKETFINDIQLLRLIASGERIMFRKDGKWIVMRDHKRVCEDCIHTHCQSCKYH